jgi:hypothetical protein
MGNVAHAFKSGPLFGVGAAERLGQEQINRLSDQLSRN